MKEKIDKNICKIFLIFLFLQPVLDVFTSLMLNVFKIELTIGIIVRVLFLLFFAIYLLIEYRKKISPKSYLLFGTIIAYIIMFTTSIFLFKDSSALAFELKNTMRAFYFPVALLIFYEISNQKDIRVEKKHLCYILITYMVLIFLPMITNSSFNGYTQGKIGTIGWFNSTNEISAIFSCLLPVFIHWLWTEKKWQNIIYFLILLIILFQLGSKIVIVSLAVSIVINIVLFLKRKTKKERNTVIKWMAPVLVVILIASILFVPRTSFYKNIKLHAEFLGVNSPVDLIKPEVIDRFIFSDRLTFLKNTNDNYHDSNLLEKFTGIGYIESYATDEVSTKMIEMDPFDIFYRHGILGFAIYFATIAYVIYNIMKKRIKDKEEKVLIIASIIMSFIMSLLTGHVLLAPAVSIYLVVLILNIREKNI